MLRKVVFGVDPGNKCSGVAVFCPFYTWSTTMTPWMPQCMDALPYFPKIEPHVFVEVPQNGTHDSRGGVHWAGGMLAARLVDLYHVPRSRVHKVRPDEWRSHFVSDPKSVDDWKAYAIQYVEEMYGIICDTHDEAEAVMIGEYGVAQVGK